jgi:hypothetical protein
VGRGVVNSWGSALWRSDDIHWFKFCQQWSLIAVGLAIQHNLMVVVHGPTDDVQRQAAHEIATTIIATLHTAREASRGLGIW